MADHTISASALIAAPAKLVYRTIADYRDGHPHILPKPPFGALVVEQGGMGEGTVIGFEMRLLGRTQHFQALISEPEPGRVLVETDLRSGATTTFTVRPAADDQQSWVTIATTTKVRAGLAGQVEAWLTTRLLRPIYQRELAQLATFITQLSGSPGEVEEQ